ncbi:hypothetical protein [Streptomyces chattanoogensis]|uniref:hypothetical protein n=1 Tax=Streptomyces chattanoogensis TaxID=66876 RepID=UPI0036C7FD8B
MSKWSAETMISGRRGRPQKLPGGSCDQAEFVSRRRWRVAGRGGETSRIRSGIGLKRFRSIATRYDKIAESYEPAIALTSLLMWKRLDDNS